MIIANQMPPPAQAIKAIVLNLIIFYGIAIRRNNLRRSRASSIPGLPDLTAIRTDPGEVENFSGDSVLRNLLTEKSFTRISFNRNLLAADARLKAIWPMENRAQNEPDQPETAVA